MKSETNERNYRPGGADRPTAVSTTGRRPQFLSGAPAALWFWHIGDGNISLLVYTYRP